MTNQFPGLERGPIDPKACFRINAISNTAIDMGSGVITFQGTPFSELLPRVSQTPSAVENNLVYGIVVGGDTDGIYGDGSPATNDSTRAATKAGQTVVVVTAGRCLARVKGFGGTLDIGTKLTLDTVAGQLRAATSGDHIIATALQPIAPNEVDMIAVQVNAVGESI